MNKKMERKCSALMQKELKLWSCTALNSNYDPALVTSTKLAGRAKLGETRGKKLSLGFTFAKLQASISSSFVTLK